MDDETDIYKYHLLIYSLKLDLNIILTHMRASTTTLLERTVLKSILPVVESLDEWTSPILLLGRIVAVTYEHKEVKERKPKCIKCGAIF